MIRWLTVALRLALAGLKSRRNLLLENLALRHQLLVLSRARVMLRSRMELIESRVDSIDSVDGVDNVATIGLEFVKEMLVGLEKALFAVLK